MTHVTPGADTATAAAVRMNVMGSMTERHKFFASEAKPPYGFRDRAPARRIAACGWNFADHFFQLSRYGEAEALADDAKFLLLIRNELA